MGDQFDPDPLLAPGPSPADPRQAGQFALGQAGQFLGVPDMVRALRGQMTPEEGQEFFASQVPSLLGPEVKFGGSLAALGLLPRVFKEGEHIPQELSLWGTGRRPDVHTFDITNELNKAVGRTWIRTPEYDPSTLHIEMIHALDPETGKRMFVDPEHTIGLRELRTLAPELKKHFPEAKKVEGFRISGARAQAREDREAAGKTGWVNSLASIPLK